MSCSISVPMRVRPASTSGALARRWKSSPAGSMKWLDLSLSVGLGLTSSLSVVVTGPEVGPKTIESENVALDGVGLTPDATLTAGATPESAIVTCRPVTVIAFEPTEGETWRAAEVDDPERIEDSISIGWG